MADCIVCQRISLIEQGKNPHFIEELEHSYLVLADNQFYEGYCIHLLKNHREQLPELPRTIQLQLANEVARTAEAIYNEFDPVRMNYGCLCNECPHIHWHVIPRYSFDPEPKNAIWTITNLARATEGSSVKRLETIERIQQALKERDISSSPTTI